MFIESENSWLVYIDIVCRKINVEISNKSWTCFFSVIRLFWLNEVKHFQNECKPVSNSIMVRVPGTILKNLKKRLGEELTTLKLQHSQSQRIEETCCRLEFSGSQQLLLVWKVAKMFKFQNYESRLSTNKRRKYEESWAMDATETKQFWSKQWKQRQEPNKKC